jgi:uncharacterized protein YegP (UPF0339 family)
VRFVLKKTSNGQFRFGGFNLIASNGQTVATSETYTGRQSATGQAASCGAIRSKSDASSRPSRTAFCGGRCGTG